MKSHISKSNLPKYPYIYLCFNGNIAYWFDSRKEAYKFYNTQWKSQYKLGLSLKEAKKIVSKPIEFINTKFAWG